MVNITILQIQCRGIRGMHGFLKLMWPYVSFRLLLCSQWSQKALPNIVALSSNSSMLGYSYRLAQMKEMLTRAWSEGKFECWCTSKSMMLLITHAETRHTSSSEIQYCPIWSVRAPVNILCGDSGLLTNTSQVQKWYSSHYNSVQHPSDHYSQVLQLLLLLPNPWVQIQISPNTLIVDT